jgi:outer membrane protein assembly factor BamB
MANRLESTARSTSGLRRTWLPGFTLAITLLLISLIRRGSGGEADDPAMTALGQIVLGMLAGLVVLSWFMFLSGLPIRAKMAGLGIVALVCAGFWSSVRKIELTGDFLPVFEFRWSPDSQALLAMKTEDPESKSHLVGWTLADETKGNPGFRGLNRDGLLPIQPLSNDWKSVEPRCLWRHPIGGGYAGFAVVGPILVTIEQRGSDEAIVAYDKASGGERWQYRYPASFQDVMTGDGPRATPSIRDHRVYSIGATSQLCCLDALTGNLVWNVDLLKDNYMGIVDCGMAGSPLLFENLVIVHAGVQNGSDASRSLLAYDAVTGKRVWESGREPIGYVSPQLASIGGTPQLLIFDKTGLAGHDPRSGKELWRYGLPTPQGVLAAQPLVLEGDRIFFSAHETCQVAKIVRTESGWSAEKVWESNTLKCNFASATNLGDSIFGLDKGILTCIDSNTGKKKWKKGRLGHGQILRMGDKLLIQSEQGAIVLAQANPNEPFEITRFPALDGKTWNMPALVDSILYVRNHHEMAAYDLRPIP